MRDRRLIGEAGEHYVLYRLCRAEILAGQTPRGTRDFDLLVYPEGAEPVKVQVKTRTTRGGNRGWRMSERHQAIRDERTFYAFVDLSEPEHPFAYVVPSEVVAKCVGAIRKVAKSIWLCPDFGNLDIRGYPACWLDEYRERWDLLGAPSRGR